MTTKASLSTSHLDARLRWIAEQVRPDVLLVDIGSDHAWLPIELVQSKKITRAIASDVAASAVVQAQTHVQAAGLAAAIEVCLGNGLAQLTLPDCVDIAICGMGAQTMVSILHEQPAVRRAGVRLLLQAMTDTPLLRVFLAGAGFAVSQEACVFSEGRYYQCMVAVYTGEVRSLSAAEAELGDYHLRNPSAAFVASVRERLARVEKWRQVKAQAGTDTSADDALLQLYISVLKDSHNHGFGL